MLLYQHGRIGTRDFDAAVSLVDRLAVDLVAKYDATITPPDYCDLRDSEHRQLATVFTAINAEVCPLDTGLRTRADRTRSASAHTARPHAHSAPAHTQRVRRRARVAMASMDSSSCCSRITLTYVLCAVCYTGQLKMLLKDHMSEKNLSALSQVVGYLGSPASMSRFTGEPACFEELGKMVAGLRKMYQLDGT
jgi:hypothetical protein